MQNHSTCGLQGVTEKERATRLPDTLRVGVRGLTEEVPARRESAELSELEAKPPRTALDGKYFSILERPCEGDFVRAEDGGWLEELEAVGLA